MLINHYSQMRGFDDVLRPVNHIKPLLREFRTKIMDSKFDIDDYLVGQWLNAGIEYKQKSMALKNERMDLESINHQHHLMQQQMQNMIYGQSILKVSADKHGIIKIDPA